MKIGNRIGTMLALASAFGPSPDYIDSGEAIAFQRRPEVDMPYWNPQKGNPRRVGTYGKAVAKAIRKRRKANKVARKSRQKNRK